MVEAVANRKEIVAAAVLNSMQLLQSLLGVEDITCVLEENEQDTKDTRQTPIRILSYIETVIPQMSMKQFQNNFRINRQTYDILLGLLKNLIKKENVLGRKTIDLDKQLLAVLWLLATPDSYRSVGERFNMGKSSLSDSFCRIITALNQLAPQIIKWPQVEARQEIKQRFSNMGDIDGVVGVVDGTYVPIKAPKTDPEVYVTRKCQYAMTLQAVCNPSLKFTDCFIGYPGSVSDCRIFRNSHLYQNTQQNKAAYFQNDEFLLGDKAYPLLSWCIPPYIERGNIGGIKRHFNHVHSQTRQTIERTFALLFGRFRRLKYLDMHRVDLIPSTVLATCVLHNLCIQQNDIVEEYIAEGRADVQGDLTVGNDEHRLGDLGGVEIRDNLCRRLYDLI